MPPKLYHMGIRGKVARSTLADANETRDWRIFDICAAPFGTGFFFSWWLGDPAPSGIWGIILTIPVVGAFAQRFFKPLTYYNMDTSHMVQGAISFAIKEVLETITKANGRRSLTDDELKPVMKDLFAR
jgi:hypothetical protein